MEIRVRALTENCEILNRCRNTVGKSEINKEPSEKFMDNIYIAEHSPIRDKWFSIQIRGIKSWIATHLSRHSIGYTPYISTQRDDRLEYSGSRDELPQGQLVDMDITLNAQAFINVSRKRLCGQAHDETQEVWNKIIEELSKIDKTLASKCVPECVYRGYCPEIFPCNNGVGRVNSPKYKKLRKEYIGNRPQIIIE